MTTFFATTPGARSSTVEHPAASFRTSEIMIIRRVERPAPAERVVESTLAMRPVVERELPQLRTA